MKSFKFLFVATAALLMASAVSAQRTTFVNRNNDERFAANKTTLDSTLTYIDSIVIKANEGGMIESQVFGYAKDTAYSVTGQINVRFNKRRGTLTMGTVNASIPIVTDAALGTSTFTYVAANGKIYLQVKGKAATSITWTSITKRKSVSYP